MIVAVTGFLMWRSATLWDRLRDTAEQVQAPDGFTLVERSERGSAACFVSCNRGEPVIELTFSTELLDEAAICQALRPVVLALTGAEVEAPDATGSGCVTVALPHIHHDASATVGATTASPFGPPSADVLWGTVTVSSGIE